MQKIIPHLWFDTQAAEAANFYSSVFPDSKVLLNRKITDTPSGDCDIVSFNVMGYTIQAISAGPFFKINPSISFMVNFNPSKDPEAMKSLDEVWSKLSEGGQVMMPLDTYPFSKRYGWVQDRFGVSWQLMLTNPGDEERSSSVIPSLMFTQDKSGKAEEATAFYRSVFKDSKLGRLEKYPAVMGPEKAKDVMFSDFALEGQWFIAMDGGVNEHDFTFGEGLSFVVKCDTQDEVDHYWNSLSAVPEAEQCGWLKDQYGISWQIVPTIMDELMESGDQAKIALITQAFLQMKKFDIAKLKAAAAGNDA
jgi:predicted 3-demethylubiquinone-9 3-methyltransferase (glyoxalase superfamily)